MTKSEHIAWPSINRFDKVVQHVNANAAYNQTPLPTLTFEGTVKLHGTNASIAVTKDNIWYQSRSQIITVENDNAGFAKFASALDSLWRSIAFDIIPQTDEVVVIFGEWCGGNIQAGVALNQLPKMFVVFGIQVNGTYLDVDNVKACMEGHTGHVAGVYCIYDFPTYIVNVDFNNLEVAKNQIEKIVHDVELNCPVGNAFGVKGVGEGVVFKCIEDVSTSLWFKAKGEKHSKSNRKRREIAPIDAEKAANLQDLVDMIVTNGRLDQMRTHVFDTLNGGNVEVERMGEFIKAVMHDIIKEEAEVLAASGFTTKDVSKPVADKCRSYIFDNGI